MVRINQSSLWRGEVILNDRILVTGFKPFLGEIMNPSEVLLEHIKRDFAVAGRVDTLVLPVSFAMAFSELEKHLRNQAYQHIFLLGQAGERDTIYFERVGLNWIETQKPDEDGYTPKQGAIEPGATAALFSRAPLTAWVEELKSQGLRAKISLSAGGYVCNHVYYKTLRKFQNETETSVVFIHLPYLPEQAQNKPQGTPCLDLETMKKTLYPVLSKYI